MIPAAERAALQDLWVLGLVVGGKDMLAWENLEVGTAGDPRGEGITIEDAHVVKVDAQGFLWCAKLAGQIPDALGSLQQLTILNLRCNKLTGPVPEALGELQQLTELDLGNNRLTGPIPDALGKLQKLTQLGLKNNQLTGPLPASLGDLQQLRGLFLNNNRLTGPIPDSLGRLQELKWLALSGNQFTGVVGTEPDNYSDKEGVQAFLRRYLPGFTIAQALEHDRRFAQMRIGDPQPWSAPLQYAPGVKVPVSRTVKRPAAKQAATDRAPMGHAAGGSPFPAAAAEALAAGRVCRPESFATSMTGALELMNKVVTLRPHQNQQAGQPAMIPLPSKWVLANFEDALLAPFLARKDTTTAAPLRLALQCRGRAHELHKLRTSCSEAERKLQTLTAALSSGAPCTAQAVTARDQIRSGLVVRLQWLLQQHTAVECPAMLACAAECNGRIAQLLAVLGDVEVALPQAATAGNSPDGGLEMTRVACFGAQGALGAWRQRHSHVALAAATDAALDQVWDNLAAERRTGYPIVLDQQLLDTASAALLREHAFHSINDPTGMSDMPVGQLLAAARAMHSFYASTAQLLAAAAQASEWAALALSRHQTALALPYPPSTATLCELQATVFGAEEDIELVQVQIRHGRRRNADVTALQAQLETLKDALRSSSAVGDLMRERSRLYTLARAYFPELLYVAPGATWSADVVVNRKCQQWASDVGISESTPSSDAAQRGLLAVGRKLTHFVSRTPVASSGGKLVYHATDAEGREWAIKEFSVQSERHLRQFFGQVRLLDSLSHPQIAAVHAVFEDARMEGEGQAVFIQMPWYSGGDLAAWLAAKPAAERAPAQCVQITRDVLLGLQHLHAGEHVHCDIKPSNILLTRAGRAVLGDFDGVRRIDASATVSMVLAAPLYLAPEMRDGVQREFTTACDVYSAGLVAEELFVGVPVTDELAQQRDSLLGGLKCEAAAARLTAAAALALPFLSEAAPTEPQRQCGICFEVVPRSKGVVCEAAAQDGQHFTCDDCLDGWVQGLASEEGGAKSRLVRHGGRVPCTMPGCASPAFSPHAVSQHTTAEAHAMFLRAIEQATRSDESRRLQAAHNEAVAAMRREFMETLTHSAAEQAAKQGELHVVDNILTLRCPRCNVAFLDFEGCFAINCRCGCAFCGWCLEPCGYDAHPHVRGCPHKLSGSDGFFGTFSLFQQAQNLRRSKLLRAYLDTIAGDELRTAIEKRLEPHLRDIGIKLPTRAPAGTRTAA